MVLTGIDHIPSPVTLYIQGVPMKNIHADLIHDPSGFVLLAEHVPGIIQEIRYYSTYN